MSVIISAHKLEKSFAARTLFRSLTFAIESGDRIGLIGPNGAGKSTLLRIMAGSLKSDGGDLSVARGTRIGHLEQTPMFSKGATVYETLLAATLDPYDSVELARVDQILSQLGLSGGAAGDPAGRVTPDTIVTELSGGWQKRVALARELVRQPELLLLDEPTNHLDVEGIQWLEDFISTARFATVTITHDRLFLQRVANRIFDLDPKYPDGLLVVKGEYLQYLETRDELIRSQERREVVLRNTLRRETEWLRRGAKARTTKQQARIVRAGDLKEEVDDLAGRNLKRKLLIDFQEAERHPQQLIEAKGLGKSFGGRTLFRDLDFVITPKTRLGLLGPNGCGKSTLIRCLLGSETPDSGQVKRADKIEVAYFEQHREGLDPRKSVLRNICPEGDYVNFRGSFIFARSYLDRFLFRTEQHDLPVEKLSGGEQARLRVAQMMLRPANILVLDEPTNDLDLATLAVLEEVLSEFNGAVILVTHDRFFLDQVSNRILAFARNSDGSSDIEPFASFSQWEEWNDARQAELKAANAGLQKERIGLLHSNSPGSSSKTEREMALESAGESTSKKKARKLSYNEKRELESMESRIQEREAALVQLQQEAQKPENLANAPLLADLYQQIGETQESIDRLYERWAELEAEG
jgi:ATP-binding cassette subfamily F protein uup